MEEKWIINAKEMISNEVDLEIWNLERLAEKENLDVEWVIETFLNKFQYAVKKRG